MFILDGNIESLLTCKAHISGLHTACVPLISLNGIYCLVCELRLDSARIPAPGFGATFPETFSPSATCLQSASPLLLAQSLAA